MKHTLYKEDIENETEVFLEALSSATAETFKNVVYTDDIDINSYIKIRKVYNDSYSLSLNLPIEEKFLLSFGNPQNLDGAYFDVEALIWNEIINNDDDFQEYNHYTVEQENIFDLYYEIEQEILNNELTISKKDFNMDLISLIDIDLFITEYFKFQNKVNIEYLTELIEQGINGVEKWISNLIKEYFQSEEYFDLINDIECYELDYLWSEINKNGFVEVYI